MQNARRGRMTAVAAVAAFLLVLAVAAGLVIEGRELSLSRSSVHAAPLLTYDITSSIDLGNGVRLRRGTLQLEQGPGKTVTGPDLVPQDGSAALVVENGAFQIAGTSNTSGTDASELISPLADALIKLKFETLTLRRSSVRVKLPSGHSETLTDVNAQVQIKRKTSLAIRGTGTLRGQNVSFDIAGPALLERGKPGTGKAVKATIKSSLFDVVFDGRLMATDAMRLQGNAEIGIANLRQMAQWFGAPWPAGPGLRDIKLKGEVDWQAPALAFDKATFSMDGDEATGTLALAFNGSQPNLTGTLAFKSLSLIKYFAPDTRGQLAAMLPWFGNEDVESPAPIGRQIDADVRISAGRVLLPNLETGRFAASVSLKNGRMQADIAEIVIDSGQGSGQVTADLMDAEPKFTVRGKLEGLEASHASTLLFGRNAVQGLSIITVDLTARGDSGYELLRDLRGKATLSMREGGRLGIDVKSLMGAAQKDKVEGWDVATRGQTSVDGLEAKFKVDGGVVASEFVQATIGDSLLKAFGTISLASRQIDLRLLLDAAPAAAARAQASLPRDVLTFRGPWHSPSIQVER